MKKKHCNDLAKGVLIFQKAKKGNLDLRRLIFKVNCIAIMWMHGR